MLLRDVAQGVVALHRVLLLAGGDQGRVGGGGNADLDRQWRDRFGLLVFRKAREPADDEKIDDEQGADRGADAAEDRGPHMPLRPIGHAGPVRAQTLSSVVDRTGHKAGRALHRDRGELVGAVRPRDFVHEDLRMHGTVRQEFSRK